MRRLTVGIVAATLCAALVPLPASAGTRSQTKRYVLPVGVSDQCDPVTSFGGPCFLLHGDEITASVAIADDELGWPVGATYRFLDYRWDTLDSGNMCGSVSSVPVPYGAYELWVEVDGPLGPVNCLEESSPGVGSSGTVTATFEITGPDEPPPPPPPPPSPTSLIDEEQACLEAVPHAASVGEVTDDGETVSLEVAVLLDGVDEAIAAHAVAVAAEHSYAALGIALNAVSYTPVNFTGNDPLGLIYQAKAHVGWKRPPGSDVVYVMTAKDIAGASGYADCVGGVERAERAFAVGEVIATKPLGFGFTFYRDGTAKLLAHEIGHLMGAHHHYANCVEGNLGFPGLSDTSPCTVMFGQPEAMSLNFSSLNAAIVRGHASQYAAP